MSQVNQVNKNLVYDFWQRLETQEIEQLPEISQTVLSPDCHFYGPDPIPPYTNPENFLTKYWMPLRQSFTNLKRETHLLIGGPSNGHVDGKGDGRMWVGGTGLLHGKFIQDYLSIPANGADVKIRWGEFCCVEDSRVSEIYVLLDLIDLLQQVGINVLPPARGVDGVYPPPKAMDGILLDQQDEAISRYSMDHIRRFIFDGLNSYDQSELKSMGMADYFDADVKWYGPGGIGACLSFREFEQLHQQPWLHAFPDRQVQDLTALITEGYYSGGPGWAGVSATHSGDYLGVASTGNKLVVNGLDFWKRDGEKYIENWVFVDMIHLFRQFGVDLMARIKQ